jgi:hypothetical protein
MIPSAQIAATIAESKRSGNQLPETPGECPAFSLPIAQQALWSEAMARPMMA